MKSRLVHRNDLTFYKTIKECLDNNLYNRDWMFETLLRNFNDDIISISVVYEGTRAVACGLVWNYPEVYNIPGEHIGVFVLPVFRRKGYGSEAVRVLGGTEGRGWKIGEDQSQYFWEKESLCLT